MTEIPIMYKPVHWFAPQIGFYMIGTSVIKELTSFAKKLSIHPCLLSVYFFKFFVFFFNKHYVQYIKSIWVKMSNLSMPTI